MKADKFGVVSFFFAEGHSSATIYSLAAADPSSPLLPRLETLDLDENCPAVRQAVRTCRVSRRLTDSLELGCLTQCGNSQLGSFMLVVHLAD